MKDLKENNVGQKWEYNLRKIMTYIVFPISLIQSMYLNILFYIKRERYKHYTFLMNGYKKYLEEKKKTSKVVR